MAIGLLLLRLVVGLTLAAHGAQKLFGWFGGPGLGGFSGMLGHLGIRPERPFALVAALAEFAGGLLLALGLLTPVAGLVIAADLLVAIAAVHWTKGFFNQGGGYEFPLTLMAAGVAVALIGPGPLSLDQLFRIAMPEPATWIVVGLIALIGAVAAMVSPRLRQARARAQLG